MKRKSILILALLAMLLTPASLAQDADTPTLAILRFGAFFSFTYAENALIDSLLAHGLINEDEHAIAHAGGDVQGERLNIHWGDANFDFTATHVIVEEALDKEADVLVVFSTPTAQTAINITSDMDDPPAVLFTAVHNPVEAGIAQATCVKPAHVTGIELLTRYEDIVPLLLLQNPDMQTVGTLYSSSETSGRLGAEAIMAVAAELGLTVEVAPVASMADLALAAESLVGKGVEAFIIPSDLITISGLPAIMQIATEYGIPVFHSSANTINVGATVSAGASDNTLQGSLLGAMVAGYLSGELDISRAGIALVDNLNVGVNLDAAARQGIDISQALVERADITLDNEVMWGRRITQMLESFGLDEDEINLFMVALTQTQLGGGELEAELPEELDRLLTMALASQARADDIAAILDSLRCTDAMIAEQQAALES